MLSGEEAGLTSVSPSLLVVCGLRRKAMKPLMDYAQELQRDGPTVSYKFKHRSVDAPSPFPETCRSPKIVDRDESRRSLRFAFQYSRVQPTRVLLLLTLYLVVSGRILDATQAS